MTSDRSSISERSRLIQTGSAPTAESDYVRVSRDSSNAPSARQPGIPHRITLAVLCMLLLLVFEFAATLLSISMSQIQEGIICRNFYPDVDDTTKDARCKNEQVQSELSTIQGWGVTFALIPGVITAVPYGIAADKYGRRIILSLSLLGTLLVEAVGMTICRFPDIFPLRLVWLAAFLYSVGGGPFVFNAMIFTIVSDVSTEAQRSTVFFYVAAVAIGGNLLSGPLAYLAVESSAWLSSYIGLASLLLSVIVALAFPETRALSVMGNQNPSNDKSSDDSVSDNDPKSQTLWAQISDMLELQQVVTILRKFFWENRQLGLLLISLTFTTLGNYATAILMQYTTKRFGWTWAKAGLLSSISAFVNLVLLVAILPAISQVLLVRFRVPPIVKDALLARAGIIALVMGAFGIGLSSTPLFLIATLVVYSLGYGYQSSLRSLLVILAGEQHTAMLFTAMSALQNVGMLVAGPLMAWTFRVGLRWGGFWIGLPFFMTGCLFSCAACILFGVRVTNLPMVQRNRAP